MSFDHLEGAIFALVIVAMLVVAHALGENQGRQSVEAVACEPVVVGLRKNGKEIPLTSAQRDSLANDLRVRGR